MWQMLLGCNNDACQNTQCAVMVYAQSLDVLAARLLIEVRTQVVPRNDGLFLASEPLPVAGRGRRRRWTRSGGC